MVCSVERFEMASLLCVPSAASFVLVVANAFPFSLWGLAVALVEVVFVGVEPTSRSDIVLSTWCLAGGGFSEIDADASTLSFSRSTSFLMASVK